MVEIDLHKCAPWDIPVMTCVGGKEWYFYSRLDRKYATGSRTNRATASGYWKATGKDMAIVRKGALVGMRKTLVFYHGRAPKGRKTDWFMHEFRVDGSLNHSKNLRLLKDEWLLCRVFHKIRDVGPKPGIGGELSALSPPPLMDRNLASDQHAPANMSKCPASPSRIVVASQTPIRCLNSRWETWTGIMSTNRVLIQQGHSSTLCLAENPNDLSTQEIL